MHIPDVVPEVVGVPVITPVVEFRLIHDGKVEHDANA
jgi:hypothetical protein